MAVAIERICGRIWARPENGRLIVLFGENGSGKTTAATAIHRWIQKVGPTKQFMVRQNHVQFLDAMFWGWPQLLDSFKNGNWDVVEDLFGATVLILDELGGGHDPSFVGVDKLCQVLSKRENKWTIVTTNVLPAHWEEKFDRRIASRLTDSEWIELSDVPDYRNMKGLTETTGTARTVGTVIKQPIHRPAKVLQNGETRCHVEYESDDRKPIA